MLVQHICTVSTSSATDSMTKKKVKRQKCSRRERERERICSFYKVGKREEKKKANKNMR